MALVIGFVHFFYMTREMEDWNTGEDGSEHRCVLFKHTRVFTTRQEGAVGRGCVKVGQNSALALPGTLVRTQCESNVKAKNALVSHLSTEYLHVVSV